MSLALGILGIAFCLIVTTAVTVLLVGDGFVEHVSVFVWLAILLAVPYLYSGGQIIEAYNEQTNGSLEDPSCELDDSCYKFWVIGALFAGGVGLYICSAVAASALLDVWNEGVTYG